MTGPAAVGASHAGIGTAAAGAAAIAGEEGGTAVTGSGSGSNTGGAWMTGFAACSRCMKIARSALVGVG